MKTKRPHRSSLAACFSNFEILESRIAPAVFIITRLTDGPGDADGSTNGC